MNDAGLTLLGSSFASLHRAAVLRRRCVAHELEFCTADYVYDQRNGYEQSRRE